jgi:hypothetical protein
MGINSQNFHSFLRFLFQTNFLFQFNFHLFVLQLFQHFVFFLNFIINYFVIFLFSNSKRIKDKSFQIA